MNEMLTEIIKSRNVQRALTLIAVSTLAVVGFMAVRGTMPFMPVFGTSMEPELHAGSMIFIESKEASEIKEGDVIVYTVTSAIRDYYNYPPVVAHRVIEVRDTEYGISFRTKGDNSGEDPFTIRPQDLRGTVSKQIPYLGLPLLFLQSQQGLIFVVISLLLFAFYLYAIDIGRGGQKIHRGIFAPVIDESQRASELLAQRVENTEKGMEYTQQALNSFAAAIAEYAEHLKSHTGAIQGLSEASQELKRGAVEQNRVLSRIAEVMEQGMPTKKAEIPETKTETPEVTKPGYPPGCFRSRQSSTDESKLVKAG